MINVRFPADSVIYHHPKNLLPINSFSDDTIYLYLYLNICFIITNFIFVSFKFNDNLLLSSHFLNFPISVVITFSNCSHPNKIYLSHQPVIRTSVFWIPHVIINVENKQFGTQHQPSGDATSNVLTQGRKLSQLHNCCLPLDNFLPNSVLYPWYHIFPVY